MRPAVRRPQEKVRPSVRCPQTKGKPLWGQPFGNHRRRSGQLSGAHRTLEWCGGQRSWSYTRETETLGRTRTDRLMGAAQDAVSVGRGEDLFVRPAIESLTVRTCHRALTIYHKIK